MILLDAEQLSLKLRVKSAVSYMIVGYNDYDVTWWQNDLIFRLQYLDEHAYIQWLKKLSK